MGRDATAPMLVVDGNSLLHRAYYAMAGSGLRSADGAATWALKGLWALLGVAVSRVGAGGAIVAFDSPDCHRLDSYPDYKAGRAEKDADLRAQLDAAPEHLRRAGLHVATATGFEADDLLASAATRNQSIGLPTVIVTSDRDAFSLISDEGAGVRVLRAINGGPGNWPLLTADRLEILCGVEPAEYRLFAALRGDSSDNLPGVMGIGPKTAVTLIAYLRDNLQTMDSMLTDFDRGGDGLRSAIGAGMASKFADETSRINLIRNLELMRQVDDLDVGGVGETSFPICSLRLSAEISRWGFDVDVSPFAEDLKTPAGANAPQVDLRADQLERPIEAADPEPAMMLF